MAISRRKVVAMGVLALPAGGAASAHGATFFVLQRVAASATVRAAMESVDLTAWAFQLTSEEYVSCAPREHHGSVQAQLADGRRVFVSVETIGGLLLSHSYLAEVAARNHLRAVSPASQVIPRSGAPYSVRVTWELKLEPLTAESCRLDCAVLVETADRELAQGSTHPASDAPGPLQAHCSVETPLYAADIERKALQGFYRSRG
ncbi:MAG TPA: hypothetical protein VFE10_08660 [Phenylobacterium sp.]|jgi:hypothetical protein|nr:hypothetical protein [Phenylobacterium sp.]